MTNTAIRTCAPVHVTFVLLCIVGLAACGDSAAALGANAGSSSAGSAGPSGGGTGGEVEGAGGGGASGGAGPSPLTVRTVNATSEAPIAGVPVVVSSANGSLASSATSGADGTVEVEVPAGGFVSVLWAHHERTVLEVPALRAVRQVRTFHPPLGLEEIVVALAPSDTLPPAPMALSFDVPSIEGATDYRVLLSCGVAFDVQAGAMTKARNGYAGCPGQDTFDAVLVAYGAEGMDDGALHPVDYAVRSAIAFEPAAEATVRFDFDEPGARLAGVAVGASGGFGDLHIELTSIMGTASGPRLVDELRQQPASADVALRLEAATGEVSSYCWAARWQQTDADAPDARGEARSECTAQLPARFDFDGGRLATPTVDASRTEVSFSLPWQGEVGDGIELLAQRQDSAGASRWQWSAVRDPETFATFVFPELPAALSAFAFGGPDAGEPRGVEVTVANVDLVDIAHGFVAAMAPTRIGQAAGTHPVESAFRSVVVD